MMAFKPWSPAPHRRLFRRNVTDAVTTELAFHLAMLEHDLVRRGVEPDEARRLAATRFNNLDNIAAECRNIGQETERGMRRTEYLQEFLDDVRFAMRQLLKAPAFAVVAVLTLALGIGATTVIFSAVDAVLLKRFAFAHPDRAVFVNEFFKGQDGDVSAGNYLDWAAMSRSFSALTAEEFRSFNLTTPEAPERVLGGGVTANFFPALGVAPLHGRVFTAAEDEPGNDAVVILGEGLWRSHYGGDLGVIGRPVQLDGRARTVIGIMPAGFDPTVSQEQLWVPVAFDVPRRAQHDEHYLNVVGILKPGVTVQQAQRDMDGVSRIEHQRFPNDANGSHVVGLVDFITAQYRTPLLLLQGAVLLVLLIACGNVANLQLARSSSRAREMAIRAAIGAGRGRIVRQLLTENLLLAGVAAAIALALAQIGIGALRANAPAGIPRLEQAHIGWTVAVFAIGAAAFSAVLSGLMPALQMSRRDLQGTLRESGRQSQGTIRDRVRTALIVAEVALALPVLIGAGLLLRSAMHLQRVDPGFDLNNVVMARAILPPGSPEEHVLAVQRVVDDLSHRPGIVSAAMTSQAPMGPGGTSNGLLAEGKPFSPENLVQSRLRLVTTGYLATMKLRLKQGRWFTDRDAAGAPLVMIISEAVAKAMFPGENAIGKRVGCCAPNSTKTVIGVMANVRSNGPAQDVTPEFYLPLAQAPADAWNWIGNTMSVTVRASSPDPAAATQAIRAAVRTVMPAAPVYRITTMRDALSATIAVDHFNTVLLVALGVIGMLLAAIGIYGVVGYFVAQRTHEIGIRMALGATGKQILHLLTWQGLVPIVIGLAIGAGLAMWSARLLQASLYGVSAHDPLTYAAVTAVLLLAGILATVLPARRAARVDPMQVLQ
jgi:putative ABC transport system permease protein